MSEPLTDEELESLHLSAKSSSESPAIWLHFGPTFEYDYEAEESRQVED